MTQQEFQAKLELVGQTATRVEIPFDVPAAFGGKRVPVRGTVNGAEFRSTIAVYQGRYFLVINRQVRDDAGAKAGDTVTIELDRDDEPRVVEVPEDLAGALADAPEARRTFEDLSYSHRKEYVDWIREAKRHDTRARRVGKAIDLLREGKTTHH